MSSDPSGSTAGLTVNSINFDVAGDILARYSSGTDNLVIGGSSMGNSTNDLVLGILAARSPGSANVASAVWVQNGQTFFPATLPLLAEALGGLALLRRHRKA